MHEHTWLDYGDGGGLKCPCGTTQSQFVAEGGVLPSQDSTQTQGATMSGDVSEQPAVAASNEVVDPSPFHEVGSVNEHEVGSEQSEPTQEQKDELQQPSSESVSEQPAENAAVEGADFTDASQGSDSTPADNRAENTAQEAAITNEPAESRSLNEVAKGIIDDAMTKLSQLKDML
jgi:hypothetical protein